MKEKPEWCKWCGLQEPKHYCPNTDPKAAEVAEWFCDACFRSVVKGEE